MSNKKRLDQLIQEQHPAISKTVIQSYIAQGKVKVNDRIVTKAGQAVSEDAHIEIHIEEPKYVSRAGLKLEKALDHFHIDVSGLVALDAGISTGGFTDCLLQRGIAKVYGVDVGYGQVHEKVRNDTRVILMERTNLRNLTSLPEKVDVVTLDLSFISLLKVIDVIASLIKKNGHLITLIKPQFEVEKGLVGKGGIIKNPKIHQEVVDRVIAGITQYGFKLIGWIASPIQGTMGNTEFLAYFRRE